MEDFTSGKIFMSGSLGNSPAAVVLPTLGSRGFVAPTKGRGGLKKSTTQLKPLFDPTSPDAFVLSHSFRSDEVSVVVDPYVNRHLRPHQREGVKFLYDCVMGNGRSRLAGRGAILADGLPLLTYTYNSFFDLNFSFSRNGSWQNIAVYYFDLDLNETRTKRSSSCEESCGCNPFFFGKELEARVR